MPKARRATRPPTTELRGHRPTPGDTSGMGAAHSAGQGGTENDSLAGSDGGAAIAARRHGRRGSSAGWKWVFGLIGAVLYLFWPLAIDAKTVHGHSHVSLAGIIVLAIWLPVAIGVPLWLWHKTHADAQGTRLKGQGTPSSAGSPSRTSVAKAWVGAVVAVVVIIVVIVAAISRSNHTGRRAPPVASAGLSTTSTSTTSRTSPSTTRPATTEASDGGG